MKNFNLFLLTIAILICSSFSYTYHGITFGVIGPFSKVAFTCLRTSVPGGSLGWHFIRAYRNSQSAGGPGIDPNGLTTMKNCWNSQPNGYSTSDVYMEICRGKNATEQVFQVRDQIINPYLDGQYISRSNRIFLIKVLTSSNPDCSWSQYSHNDNCEFLMEAQRAMSSFGWYLNVFTTATSWRQIFGNSCNYFGLTLVGLIYANYNTNRQLITTRSYDDFVPFGGWTREHIRAKFVGSIRVPLSCSGMSPTSVVVEHYWTCGGC